MRNYHKWKQRRNWKILLLGLCAILSLPSCTVTAMPSVSPTVIPTATSAAISVTQPTAMPSVTITSTPTSDNLTELRIINNNGKIISLRVEVPIINTDAFFNGLEGRDTLPENQGMLFQWQEDVTITFQMWHTSLPLSIAFISGSGEILEIQDMKPFYPPYPEGYTPSTPYRCALEVNQGFFTGNNICIGNTIEFTS